MTLGIDNYAYRMIKEHYADGKASRSGVPLMNHINEGLLILEHLKSPHKAKEAFCLHPIFQADIDLQHNHRRAYDIDPMVMMFVMEYRKTANYCLSNQVTIVDYSRSGTSPEFQWGNKPILSPLFQVNQMLIADKVQNYKDFLKHHAETHPRRKELKAYFLAWLDTLGITDYSFQYEYTPLLEKSN